jgi:ribosomal protein L11 methyltransferase
MELWEARMEIPAGAAEATELAMLESGFDGWSLLEDAVAKKAWIVGIFQGEAEAGARWAELNAALPSKPLGAFAPRLLPDADWKHSYRDHFKAWAFGRLHWVPVWERETFRLPQGHSVLWLDPGMAFGTGNHETTRLCIERLVEFEGSLPGGGRGYGLRVVDAGCGSGILALSASLLGFRDVLGFDNDAEAIRVSIENAELNGLHNAVRFEAAGLPEGVGSAGAGVVLANIQADILIRHSAALAAAVAPGGMLAMSGILAAEAAAVRDAFGAAAPGWESDSRVLGEWSDLCLRRPARQPVRRTAPESSA